MTRMTGPDCAVMCNLINTRMTGPDCVVMCNLINTHTHTHTHTHTFLAIKEYAGGSNIFQNSRWQDISIFTLFDGVCLCDQEKSG